MYALAADVDGKVKEYFSIDAVSGVVFLKKSLLLDPDNTKQYGVS